MANAAQDEQAGAMERGDLDAYLERIGYSGVLAANLEVLGALQSHHAAAIAFENLDPLLGIPVALDRGSLVRKLVCGGRGGYCFEQNGLFLHVLTKLGFDVIPLAARVRWMLPPGAPQTPLSHMMLLATVDDNWFVCDVGFGAQSPTAPLRLQPSIEQMTGNGGYRLRSLGAGYELDMHLPDGWTAMYRFTEDPQTLRDYEVFNWYTATHPASWFVNNLVAARVVGCGRLALFNDELTLQHGDGRRETRQLSGALDAHDVLTHDFGIRVDRREIDHIWPRVTSRERPIP